MNNLCNDLNEAFKKFYPVINLYNQWNQLWVQLYLKERSFKSKGSLIFVIIIVLMMPIPASLMVFVALIMYNYFANNSVSKNITDNTLAIVLSAIIFVLMIVIPVVIYILHKRSIKKKINMIKSEMNNTRSRLINYYNTVNSPIVPFAYSSPYVIQKLYKIAQSRMVDTVEAAINLYQKDAYNQIEEIRYKKQVKRDKLLNIAATAAVAYYLSKPDVIDIYV